MDAAPCRSCSTCGSSWNIDLQSTWQRSTNQIHTEKNILSVRRLGAHFHRCNRRKAPLSTSSAASVLSARLGKRPNYSDPVRDPITIRLALIASLDSLLCTASFKELEKDPRADSYLDVLFRQKARLLGFRKPLQSELCNLLILITSLLPFLRFQNHMIVERYD
jgi:hypothetical protein